jgi:hypothetical protein
LNADAPVEEAVAEEEEEGEREDAWASDSDELVEEDSYEKIEGDVPRLYPGAVWDEYVLHNMAETTVQGLARLRLKNMYPKAWIYNDENELFAMAMKRCPGLPLPPYASSISLCTAMDETPMDAGTLSLSLSHTHTHTRICICTHVHTHTWIRVHACQ